MISTHVLDTSVGHPAAGISVELAKQSGEDWTHVDTDRTNDDGRIVFDCPAVAGTYRLLFHTGEYMKKHRTEGFFPSVPVIFTVHDTNRKYHVPLLLSPFGYSTYRGS
jgi:5-hydroxyisourate hydrolase